MDPNGQAATWLKNNPLDGLYYGLMGLSFVPGLNIVASIGMMAIDLAKGDYTSLAMDSLGILIPGAAVGLKLSYDGVKAVVDGAKVGNEVRDVAKANTELVNTFDTYRVVKSETQVSASTEMTTALIVRPKYEIALLSDVQDIDFVAKAKAESINVSHELQHGKMYSDNGNDIAFNYQHSHAFPESPRPLGSHGGSLQSHHFMQKAVMKKASPDYNEHKAPTLTIETNARTKTVDYDLPHTIINREQTRVNKSTNYSQSIDEELRNGVQYMRNAGFSDKFIQQALNDNYRMLDKLKLNYSKIDL